MKRTWSVAVVYENDATRGNAVRFCDELVARFWESCSFDIHWNSFIDLESEAGAEVSKRKVADADLVVVALEGDGDIPLDAALWLQESLAARSEKEGALVGVFTPGENAVRDGYCRAMAHAHGLDYWTEIPHELRQTQPDSPEWCVQRAGQVTSVLDEILHQSIARSRPWMGGDQWD